MTLLAVHARIATGIGVIRLLALLVPQQQQLPLLARVGARARVVRVQVADARVGGRRRQRLAPIVVVIRPIARMLATRRLLVARGPGLRVLVGRRLDRARALIRGRADRGARGAGARARGGGGDRGRRCSRRRDRLLNKRMVVVVRMNQGMVMR